MEYPPSEHFPGMPEDASHYSTVMERLSIAVILRAALHKHSGQADRAGL
jgi:hypothetical protein